MKIAHNSIDLTGQKFTQLTALRRASSEYHEACWVCLCECGREVVVPGSSLRKGKRQRCYNSSHGIKPGRKPLGMRQDVYKLTYHSWTNMRERCLNPNHHRYKRYGGRGILICERWNDFNMFLADMGERPTIKHSIERNDSDGNYEPTNCRWATNKEQSRNTTRTIYAEYQGKRWKLIELCESLGIPYSNVLGRYRALGWPIEKALFEPIKGYKKKLLDIG